MELPKYYLRLFNALSLAIMEIDDLNFGQARKILINAQREAEDYIMDDETYSGHEFDYLDEKLDC